MATKHAYVTMPDILGEPVTDEQLDDAKQRKRIRLTHRIMQQYHEFVFPVDAKIEQIESGTIVHAEWEV
jgi:hypothetical protein